MRTTRQIQAKALALKVHSGQYRKGDGSPMVTHVIRVAETLEKYGFPEDVVIAGYLHDSVEDTDLTFEDIEKAFGANVRRIVAGNTEDKEKSWTERKQHTIDWIKVAPLEIRALIVADKLDNLRSMMYDYSIQGEELWKVFKKGRTEQSWYFTSVAEGMYTPADDISVSEFPLYFKEYEELVNSFFN